VKIILAIYSVLTLLLSGCATLSEKECAAGKWEELGTRDALNGRKLGFLEHHQMTCEAAQSDSAQKLYNTGWEQGNKKFCTAENGYSSGLSGIMLTGHIVTIDTCDAKLYPEFVEQFRLGSKVAELNRQRDEIQEQINKNSEDRSVVANVGRGLAIWNGYSPTESLDNKRAELDEKIMAIDNNAPGGPKIRNVQPSAEFLQALTARILPSDPNTFLNKAGAFVGMTLGFGSGHAIQGRYSDSGWKWTLSEVALFSLAVSTSDQDCTETVSAKDAYGMRTHSSNCVKNGKSPSVAAGTMGLWLGLRIWQSYDLWTYSGRKSEKSQSTLMLHPQGVLWVSAF